MGGGGDPRRVLVGGRVSFHSRQPRLPKAVRGQPVALGPTLSDGGWAIRFLVDDPGTLDPRGPGQVSTMSQNTCPACVRSGLMGRVRAGLHRGPGGRTGGSQAARSLGHKPESDSESAATPGTV